MLNFFLKWGSHRERLGKPQKVFECENIFFLVGCLCNWQKIPGVFVLIASHIVGAMNLSAYGCTLYCSLCAQFGEDTPL